MLDLMELFDYHVIVNCPEKYLYMEDIIRKAEITCKKLFKSCELVYIDDRDTFLVNIKREFRDLLYINSRKCQEDSKWYINKIKEHIKQCNESN